MREPLAKTDVQAVIAGAIDGSFGVDPSQGIGYPCGSKSIGQQASPTVDLWVEFHAPRLADIQHVGVIRFQYETPAQLMRESNVGLLRHRALVGGIDDPSAGPSREVSRSLRNRRQRIVEPEGCQIAVANGGVFQINH